MYRSILRQTDDVLPTTRNLYHGLPLQNFDTLRNGNDVAIKCLIERSGMCVQAELKAGVATTGVDQTSISYTRCESASKSEIKAGKLTQIHTHLSPAAMQATENLDIAAIF